ncbi:hypothetical protein [Pedobacter sp. P26]|uniref:hypothetical protein n=1 Tax=Pedobacter sp. P26 TaxID=3423956 RepID=UPI003D678FCC
MLKKHIVPFAVVATLFILAKVFAYQMPLAQKSLLKEEKLNTTIPKSDSLKVENEEAPQSLMAQLNFAEETLPLGDKKGRTQNEKNSCSTHLRKYPNQPPARKSSKMVSCN